LQLQPNGGNVGIGTTTPQQKLHVNGSILVNDSIIAQGTKNLSIGYDYATNGTYYLKTNPFGFWNETYAKFNETYADTLYAGIEWDYNQTTPAIQAAYNGTLMLQSTFNSNYSTNDPIYRSFANNYSDYLTTKAYALNDSLWTGNYSLYNSTWSSTYNSTYNTWAYNQTTPAINAILGFNYYNLTTLSAAETDPKWTGNYSASNLVLPNNVSITKNLSVDGSTFFVDSSTNNVGIGTTAPLTKVHILSLDATIPALGVSGGTLSLLESGGTRGLIQGNSAGGNYFMQVQRVDGTATAYNLQLQPNGGNVGIGTTAPQNKLNVIGQVNATQFIVNASVGLTGNYSVNGCWIAYKGGIMYGTNCTAF
jgi:hypothetical protein